MLWTWDKTLLNLGRHLILIISEAALFCEVAECAEAFIDRRWPVIPSLFAAARWEDDGRGFSGWCRPNTSVVAECGLTGTRYFVSSRVSTTAGPVMDAGDLFTVTLDGGRPWGLRLQGGYEYAQRIRVAKVGDHWHAWCDRNRRVYVHWELRSKPIAFFQVEGGQFLRPGGGSNGAMIQSFYAVIFCSECFCTGILWLVTLIYGKRDFCYWL